MYKLKVAELNLEIEYKYPTMIKQAEAYKADFERPNIRIEITDENLALISGKIHTLVLTMWSISLRAVLFMRLCLSLRALCSILPGCVLTDTPTSFPPIPVRANLPIRDSGSSISGRTGH